MPETLSRRERISWRFWRGLRFEEPTTIEIASCAVFSGNLAVLPLLCQ
jgi:hypothetical protein